MWSKPARSISFLLHLASLICMVDFARAQDAATCYSGGILALSVVLALILAAVCIAMAYFLWTKYWKARKAHHLILETDPEKGKGEYAFDNPGFRDAGLSPEKANSKLDCNLKVKWNQWSPLGVLTLKNEKKKTVDDSEIENQLKNVTLRSHDFTGLGFTICGNMKEGIFVKDILHRGPAFESKQLNVGDRIQSVLISFEHMVYEDALAILSYASPYEIVVAAKNGKTLTGSGQVGRPQHPVYRSLSAMDLNQAGKSSKRCLFEDSTSISTPYTTSNRNNMPLKGKVSDITPVKNELQKAETMVHKLGIQVLPPLENPSKSQNTNNSNHESEFAKMSTIERHTAEVARSMDEVDRQPPPVKKREKLQLLQKQPQPQEEPSFQRNGSGIRRDENDIPLELPSAMLNAAVAARKNRKSTVEEDSKSPKKKGKAPAPPEALLANQESADSDGEPGNQSSVNTIELNASDITIHQSEDGADEKRRTVSTGDLTKMQKTRKTSTGTLERAQSLDITDSGMPVLTAKKRKAGNMNESKTSSSDESLYGSALVNKEPRLSLILDGLNTFQRSRLKKSTEWGNLEDAILNMDRQGSDISGTGSSQEDLNVEGGFERKSFEIGAKSPEFDALVNKINEIKQETMDKYNAQHEDITEDKPLNDMEDQIAEELDSADRKAKNTVWPFGNSSYHQVEEILERPLVIPRKDVTNIRSIHIANGGGTLSQDLDQSFAPSQSTEPKIIDLNEKNHLEDRPEVNIDAIASFLHAERTASMQYSPEMTKLEDVNVPDDLKVSRHTVGSLDQPEDVTISNVSNVTVNHQSSEAVLEEDLEDLEPFKGISVTTPDLIKNLAIAEAIYDLNNEITIEGPTSLTLEIPSGCSPTILTQCDDTKIEIKQQNGIQMQLNGDIRKMEVPAAEENDQQSLTYITEIQVSTPVKNSGSQTNISEIEIGPKSIEEKLDNDFEQYIKNFESNIKSFESNIHHFEANIQSVAETIKSPESASNSHSRSSSSSVTIDMGDKEDPQMELKKVQDIVEEQLKKLPEMRFTTSSYEGQMKAPEKRQSQIEILRSNFEKGNSSPRHSRAETSPPKSRIPVLNKTPPMSPERRDSRNMDTEQDKDILEIMASKYPHKNRNVTVTSIRSNSRIPSGLPTHASRPPIPPKKNDNLEDVNNANGNGETFRQWVFNPNDQSVTNIAVTEGSFKYESRK